MASQSGLVSAGQLQEFGLNKSDIHRAKKAHRLKRVLPRVYECEDSEDRWRRGLQSAVLWLSTGVISHRSALKLHKLDGVTAAPIEISVASHTAKKKGIFIHRPRRPISEQDRVIIDGLPVTSVARTLFDVASVLSPEDLALAVESAWRRGIHRPAELLERLREVRASGVEGVAVLEEVLLDCLNRRRPLESGLEVRMWRLLKREGFQLPQLQYEFCDAYGVGRIDFAFPEHGIALETRGAETHSDEKAFEKDSHRTARLTALGWTVIPVTWQMLETNTPGVVRMLREALARHDLNPVKRSAPTASPREQLPLFGSS